MLFSRAPVASRRSSVAEEGSRIQTPPVPSLAIQRGSPPTVSSWTVPSLWVQPRLPLSGRANQTEAPVRGASEVADVRPGSRTRLTAVPPATRTRSAGDRSAAQRLPSRAVARASTPPGTGAVRTSGATGVGVAANAGPAAETAAAAATAAAASPAARRRRLEARCGSGGVRCAGHARLPGLREVPIDRTVGAIEPSTAMRRSSPGNHPAAGASVSRWRRAGRGPGHAPASVR